MAQLIPVKWQNPPDDLSLSTGQIDIWLFCLDRSPCETSWLDQGEKCRLSGISNQASHQRYCASHTALRGTLSRYLELAPSEIKLTTTAGGKPLLQDASPALHFNLSHSGNFALVAVCKGDIGVDVEPKRIIRDIPRVAKRVLSQHDLDALEKNHWNTDTFLSLWTKMEARQKCFGEGIFGQVIDSSLVSTHEFLVSAEIFATVAWRVTSQVTNLNFYSHYQED